MRLSVVVPAFNEEKLLGAALESLRRAWDAAAPLGWEIEAVVCDNNSTDRTPEIARAAGAQVVFEPVNQISRARNTGARGATGDWLLFLDADSRVSPELLKDLLETIARGKTAYGGAALRFDSNDRALRLGEALWNRCVAPLFRLAAGSFLFCRADLFHEAGGFSEALYASEEIDLSRRLRRLARRRHAGRFAHLSRHPILTSGRKTTFYDRRTLLRFVLLGALNPRRTMRDRERLGFWYDGRR